MGQSVVNYICNPVIDFLRYDGTGQCNLALRMYSTITCGEFQTFYQITNNETSTTLSEKQILGVDVIIYELAPWSVTLVWGGQVVVSEESRLCRSKKHSKHHCIIRHGLSRWLIQPVTRMFAVLFKQDTTQRVSGVADFEIWNVMGVENSLSRKTHSYICTFPPAVLNAL